VSACILNPRGLKLIHYPRLGIGVLKDYTKLRADTQAKNIVAWTPVVAEILDGFCRFDDKAVCERSSITMSSCSPFFSLLNTYPLFTPLQLSF
jgi:hypothetical protein